MRDGRAGLGHRPWGGGGQAEANMVPKNTIRANSPIVSHSHRVGKCCPRHACFLTGSFCNISVVVEIPRTKYHGFIPFLIPKPKVNPKTRNQSKAVQNPGQP